MTKHFNKHIRAAISEAANLGWELVKAGPRAHIWGTLQCPEHSRMGCRVRIMSTPRNPERHARDIRRAIHECPHAAPGKK